MFKLSSLNNPVHIPPVLRPSEYHGSKVPSGRQDCLTSATSGMLCFCQCVACEIGTGTVNTVRFLHLAATVCLHLPSPLTRKKKTETETIQKIYSLNGNKQRDKWIIYIKQFDLWTVFSETAPQWVHFNKTMVYASVSFVTEILVVSSSFFPRCVYIAKWST